MLDHRFDSLRDTLQTTRVYRGEQNRAVPVQQAVAVAKAPENDGSSLGETNWCRVEGPPTPLNDDETRIVLFQAPDVDCSLAVPHERLAKARMAKCDKEKMDGKIE